MDYNYCELLKIALQTERDDKKTMCYTMFGGACLFVGYKCWCELIKRQDRAQAAALLAEHRKRESEERREDTKAHNELLSKTVELQYNLCAKAVDQGGDGQSMAAAGAHFFLAGVARPGSQRRVAAIESGSSPQAISVKDKWNEDNTHIKEIIVQCPGVKKNEIKWQEIVPAALNVQIHSPSMFLDHILDFSGECVGNERFECMSNFKLEDGVLTLFMQKTSIERKFEIPDVSDADPTIAGHARPGAAGAASASSPWDGFWTILDWTILIWSSIVLAVQLIDELT